MSKRTDWVDYAKAIGIILVVYGHVARGLFNAGIEMPETVYRLVDSMIYSFHMPLFFFLSGLFFYQSFIKRGGVHLVFNKVDSIVYPYLLWSLLQGGIEAGLSSYTNSGISFLDVLSLWEPRAQFWFLYTLFFIFLICSIFYSIISEKYTVVIFIISCILYLNIIDLPNIAALFLVAANLVYFIVGIIFLKYDIGKYISSYYSLFVLLLAFILFQYFFHIVGGQLYSDQGIALLLLALVSIFFVVSLSMTIARRPNRVLAYIGLSSMAIYLMHILAGSGVRIILYKLFAIDSVVIHLVAGCSMAILLPLLALKIIDRLKIPYLFSAPISQWLDYLYRKTLKR